jgi:hypothetical protein
VLIAKPPTIYTSVMFAPTGRGRTEAIHRYRPRSFERCY